MREGARLLAQILGEIQQEVAPGVTTSDLNAIAEDRIFSAGAEPAFKGYQGFPAALCTSVNAELVHGVPDEYELREGDIISLDCGLKWKDRFTDMAVTVPVGGVNSEKRRLMRVTKKALKRGIKKAKAGNTVGDVGNTIQRYVEDQRMGVVRNLCGHGIGREIHEPPQVFNFGRRGRGERLHAGMIICIEPMVTLGSDRAVEAEDGFTFVPADGSLSAHFEHMVLVTESGGEILTVK